MYQEKRMPAQKRPSNLQQQRDDEEEEEEGEGEGEGEESSLTLHSHHHRRKLSRCGGGGVGADANHFTSSQNSRMLQRLQNNSNEEQETEPFLLSGDRESDENNPQQQQQQQDSDDGSGTDPEEFDEIVTISRSDIRNNVQCPICLGIIRKARTVMGCLHRFCKECIDKSMRLGNKECPACRMHCASRRSLRDDVAYNRLIDALYPDAEKYEQEELLFGEEDKTRNEQIRASISRVSRHQLEASNRRRRFDKDDDDDDDLYPVRAPRSFRNLYTRRRRRGSSVQRIDVEGTEDNNGMENLGDGNESPNNNKDGAETKQKRRHERGIVFSPSTTSLPSKAKPEETSEEESTPPPPRQPVPVYNAEMFTWGRCGTRSNGSANNSRAIRGSRISMLTEHLRSVSKPKTEAAVRFALVSIENEKTPHLRKPFVCCQPNLSVNQLREHVAHEIGFLDEDIEMLLVKNTGKACIKTSANSLHRKNVPTCLFPDINWSHATLQILEGEDTLAKISCSSFDEHLVIAYRLKNGNPSIHLSPA